MGHKVCKKCGMQKQISNFPKRKVGSREYYNNECKNCRNKRNRAYYIEFKQKWVDNRNKHPNRAREIMKRYWKKLRLEVINAYGGKCVCCGETEERFLTLEHTWHDGAEHRKAGKKVYQDLRGKGFPQDKGLTIMCWNCNMATRYGEPCPHKEKENVR